MKKAVLSAFAAVAALSALAPVCGATDLHIHRKVSQGMTRIACVGDSITNGALIPNCFANAYPAKLGKLLGESYHVENFGLNDRTAQASGQKPYNAENEYCRSIAFQPDIVVLLLGSNDTKPVSWSSPERFAAEYKALLESYLALDSHPRVILCAPPWAMKPVTLPQKLINDIDVSRLPEIVELVIMIGKEYNLPVINLYPVFTGRKDLLSFDGLHPNAKGAELIAQQVYAQITGADDV